MRSVYSSHMKDGIVQIGAPVLRQKAKSVPKKEVGSRRVAKLIARMKTALKKEKFGVAIAASQVGEPLRIFVVAGRVFEPERKASQKVLGSAKPADKVFINPKIIRLSRKKKEMTEGCLSVRKKYGFVKRHEKATVRALDESGDPFIYNGTELLAQIFQHECDHLDGVLYVDRAEEIHDEPEKEK